MDKELIDACCDGNTETVRILLKNGENIHVKDDYCIRVASYRGHTQTVKLLLEHGENIHADDDFAIRHASKNGHIQTVKLLIEKGANIHVKDDYSIKFANYNGHTQTVKLLYWSYKSESKRKSLEKLLPKSKILWNYIKNCELLPLPYEIIELIKRRL
jgi:ankyrin repeat protein